MISLYLSLTAILNDDTGRVHLGSGAGPIPTTALPPAANSSSGVEAALAEQGRIISEALQQIRAINVVAASSLEDLTKQRDAMRKWGLDILETYNLVKSGFHQVDGIRQMKKSGK